MAERMGPNWFNYLKRDEAEDKGSNPAWWLYHRSRAKTLKKNPYLLANEYIAARIGSLLGLPVPPFSLMRAGTTGERYFAYLDFDGRETTARDMDAQIVCRCHPRLAAGIVAFDILIANPDRHEKNLMVDNRLNPTTLHLFDHDVCLMGKVTQKGCKRLRWVENRLGWTQGVTGTTDYHKLAEFIVSERDLHHWSAIIAQIPNWFIDDTAEFCRRLDLSAEESQHVAAFLNHRKSQVRSLIYKHRNHFPKIKEWGLDLEYGS